MSRCQSRVVILLLAAVLVKTQDESTKCENCPETTNTSQSQPVVFHMASATLKTHAVSVLELLALKEEPAMQRLLKCLEEETSTVGNYRSNITGKTFSQRYWEFLANFEYSARSNETVWPAWNGIEWAFYDFLTEFERCVDNKDMSEGKKVCSKFGNQLSVEYRVNIDPLDWDYRCSKLVSHPLKITHKHMTATIVRVGLTIVGCFAALLICILRSLLVLDHADNPDKRKEKYSPVSTRDYSQESPHYDNSYEYGEARSRYSRSMYDHY